MDIQKIKPNVERQIEKPDWDKIKALAEQKKKALGNVISDEGALHLAVQELYPDYNASQNKMSGDELKGRLISKTQLRFVDTNKNGKKKKQPVKEVYIATEDASVVQATLWGKQNIELFKNVENGDAIKLNDVKINDKDGETILNIFKNSTVEKLDNEDVKPLSEMLKPIDLSTVKKSKIGLLKGFIIQAKDNEYRKCPTCNSKLSEVEDAYHCPEHGEVQPSINKTKELTIDTGNQVISTILWSEILEDGKDPKEMEIINSVCRVYDANYYKRKKAKKNSDDSVEVLNKKFPVDLRLSIYSYDLESMKATPEAETTSAKDDADPVSIEDVKDAPK